MRRCWIISEFAYPVVVTTGYYVTEIAEYLAKKGLDVGVLTTNNTYYSTDRVPDSKHEVYKGVEYYRTFRKQVDKNNLIKRVWRLLLTSLQLVSLAKKNIKEGDVVICLTNPAFFILFMPWIRKKTRCKYHILVHDIFPENLVSIGKLSSNHILYLILKRTFDKAYATADSCISTGCDMTRVLESKVHHKTEISMITNWADVNEVYPQLKETTLLFGEKSQLFENKIIFQFAGNLGNAQGLDNVLNAISLIDHLDVVFLFVGAGAKGKDIRSFAENHANVVYVGFRDRSLQNDFLNCCDIGIVTLADGMYGLGVPSKSYNIMAVGKPILYIGESDSEIASVITKYDIGWVVEPNKPEKLKETIEKIIYEKESIAVKGAKAYDVARNVFAKDVVLERYYQFVKKKLG